MTGVKAYMVGRIKVRGDLVLAQRLEEVFERAGGRDVSLMYKEIWIVDYLTMISL